MPSGESRVLLHYEDSHHLFTIMVVARASCNRVYDWVCVRVYVCDDRVGCVCRRFLFEDGNFWIVVTPNELIGLI